jgi:hypothetical protein
MVPFVVAVTTELQCRTTVEMDVPNVDNSLHGDEPERAATAGRELDYRARISDCEEAVDNRRSVRLACPSRSLCAGQRWSPCSCPGGRHVRKAGVSAVDASRKFDALPILLMG